jgi:putative colanic acid biosynthesis acetyltransferase WcaF
MDPSTYVNRAGWRNLVARAAWGVIWLALFRTSPRPFRAWRRFLLRCFGARIGRHVTVYPGVRVWAPWNLRILDHCWIGDEVDCYNVAEVRIGPNAVVSQRAFICTASHDYEDPAFATIAAPVVVERGAWVAAEAFLAPGVTVGESAVVGARACVYRDVERWTVVGGNPARVIKRRVPPPGQGA